MSHNKTLVGLDNGRNHLATPCLVVDLDALERNVEKMARMCADIGVDLRPHAKAHKCAEIAHRQVAAGAKGVCVATVGEAETLAAAGINDLLVTSTIGNRKKIERLGSLTRRGVSVTAVVDCHEMVELFGSVAQDDDVSFNLLIDLDMGRHRAGIGDAAEARAVGEKVATNSRLHLLGMQAYAGHLSHMTSYSERKEGLRKASLVIEEMRAALSDLFSDSPIVTGGSTGTSLLDFDAGLYTEFQFGSYVFMDTEYRCVDIDGNGGAPFEPSLFLQSSVISNRHQGFVTTDGGDKRLASKYGKPPVISRGAPTGSTYRASSDEHGQVRLPSNGSLQLDARIECIVPHCDPTVNLFDELVIVRGEEVVAIWDVTARGS